jgi:hypothetical protein
MLLQIGTKGVMDSVDGTATGRGLKCESQLALQTYASCRRPGQWRHLRFGWLREQTSRRLRSRGALPAPVGASGHAGGNGRRGRWCISEPRALRGHRE